MAKWEIGVASEFVVVGQDFEMADYDNPRGEIVRERWYVLAQDAKGYRRALPGLFDSADEAGFFARTLDEESPNADDWAEEPAMYGSEAYDESDQGRMDAWAERMAA